MKKLLSVTSLFAFAASLTFSSCDKKADYTCTCKSTIAGMTFPGAVMNDTKKSDAETACENLDKNVKLIDPSGSCDLTKN